ncbi:hypothetical protein BDF14DRAFT_1462985 [Spinellus fusiger]|nr:hypothetical protein BDF14DRAFT_1462985 [Spinellus fusiger]
MNTSQLIFAPFQIDVSFLNNCSSTISFYILKISWCVCTGLVSSLLLLYFFTSSLLLYFFFTSLLLYFFTSSLLLYFFTSLLLYFFTSFLMLPPFSPDVEDAAIRGTNDDATVSRLQVLLLYFLLSGYPCRRLI